MVLPLILGALGAGLGVASYLSGERARQEQQSMLARERELRRKQMEAQLQELARRRQEFEDITAPLARRKLEEELAQRGLGFIKTAKQPTKVVKTLPSFSWAEAYQQASEEFWSGKLAEKPGEWLTRPHGDIIRERAEQLMRTPRTEEVVEEKEVMSGAGGTARREMERLFQKIASQRSQFAKAEELARLGFEHALAQIASQEALMDIQRQQDFLSTLGAFGMLFMELPELFPRKETMVIPKGATLGSVKGTFTSPKIMFGSFV